MTDSKEPRRYEAHTDTTSKSGTQPVPEKIARSAEQKSPARWAYERIVLYLQEFEKNLDAEQEVAMGFTGSDAGILRIEGMGYFDPDIVTFYGTDGSNAPMQLVQHVSQLNVILRALPKPTPSKEANRIGFRLAAKLEEDS